MIFAFYIFVLLISCSLSKETNLFASSFVKHLATPLSNLSNDVLENEFDVSNQ